MSLTDRQRADLHACMLEYLTSRGDEFASTAAAFRAEAGLEAAGATKPVTARRLEKKWVAVVRLQRKVMELEATVKQLTDDLKAAGRGSGRGAGAGGGGGGGGASGSASALPRHPARHSMSGHRGVVTCVAIHPVFTLVASCGDDAHIKLWDLESGTFERTLKGHTNSVQAVAFDPTGQLLASASADMSAKLWDVSDGGDYRCTRTLMGHDHSVTGVAFIGSSRTVATSSRDATIRVWEIDTGYCVKTLSGHGDWVRRVATNVAGDMLVSASSDQTVMVWNMPAGTVAATLRGHEHVVECVAVSSPVHDAAFAKHDQVQATKAALMESKAEDGAVVEGSSASAAAGGATGPGGAYVLSGSRDKTVRLWNVKTEQQLLCLSVHENWVRSVAFHPAGLFGLSVGEDRRLSVTDLTSGRSAKTIKDAHEHFVSSVATSPAHTVVVTGGIDKTVKVWELR